MIIKPFQFNNICNNVTNHNLNNDINVINFMKKNNDIDKLLKFIQKNNNKYIWKLMNFNDFIKLYDRYETMKNYLDNNLLGEILDSCKKRFVGSLKNKEEFTSELIKMNDMSNDVYNFNINIFNERLNVIKSKFKKINFNDFHLGTDFILTLANSAKWEELNKNHNIALSLYSKKKKTTFNSSDKSIYIVNMSDINLVMFTNENIKIVIKAHCDNNYDLLINQEKMIFDGKNIYALPDIYINIANNNITCDLLDKIQVIKVTNWSCFNHTNLNNNDLAKIKRCYICKKDHDEKVIFENYKYMCIDCGIYNYNKKVELANLKDINAFVTGIRQKIGFAIALKLLRCGCRVYGTSRFPNAALYNFSKQPDYEQFKNNLIIYGLNFVDIEKVNKLIDELKKVGLNILINNACQTLQPTDEYINKVLLFEKHLGKYLENDSSKLTLMQNKANSELMPMNESSNKLSCIIPKINNFNNEKVELDYYMESNNIILDEFNDIQVRYDKTETAWFKNIEEIEQKEIMEVTIINQLVPTLFINGLKKHMANPKFIINVTAVEGQFRTHKNSYHAHTNMCKAAINMLIRTIGEEKDKNLFAHTIDPGFVSGVSQNYDYPLSSDDGASRILDPIISYFNGRPVPKEWVKLKDYKNSDW